jgi:hypothetical protein
LIRAEESSEGSPDARVAAVCDGLRTCYERFSAHDPDGLADIIAAGPGAVIGSTPGEGHDTREGWVSTYAKFIPELDMRLEAGANPRGWQEGTVGLVIYEPTFVMPDGSYLPTRLTGVLHREGEAWKVVHLHFSVGVPDEDAMRRAE